MKNINLLLIVLLVSSSFAMDATRVPASAIFEPDLSALDAMKSRINTMKTNTDTAFEIATKANSLSTMVQKTVINEDGCVYDTGIECTTANMNYVFIKKRRDSDSPNKYFDVPVGVKTIYITLKSPRGNYYLHDEDGTITVFSPDNDGDGVGVTGIKHPRSLTLPKWFKKAPKSTIEYHANSFDDNWEYSYFVNDRVNLDISVPILKTFYTLNDIPFPRLSVQIPGHAKGGDYANGFVEIKYFQEVQP